MSGVMSVSVCVFVCVYAHVGVTMSVYGDHIFFLFCELLTNTGSY